MVQFPESLLSQVSPAMRESLVSRNESRPASLPGNNQVLVEPGGATFTSIQAAINSITDASMKKQYVLYVGPGTYHEIIVMKEWVNIEGAGQDPKGKNYSIITAASGSSETSATVTAASNASISAMTIETTFVAGNGSTCACLDCTGVDNFLCYGLQATAFDNSSPEAACNLFPVVNNRGNFGPTCSVTMFNCILTAQAQNPKSFAIALWSVSGGTYQVFDSTLTATGSYVGVGGCGNPGASNLTFTQCTITGTQYCLQTITGSVVEAIGCVLNGPVDEGVIVKP